MGEQEAECVERRANIADQVQFRLIAFVDILDELVQVDKDLVAFRIYLRGVALLNPVADGEDEVGLVEAEVLVVVPHEADGSDCIRVVVRYDPFAVDRDRNRQPTRLGKAAERRGGATAGDAMPGEKYGV